MLNDKRREGGRSRNVGAATEICGRQTGAGLRRRRWTFTFHRHCHTTCDNSRFDSRRLIIQLVQARAIQAFYAAYDSDLRREISTNMLGCIPLLHFFQLTIQFRNLAAHLHLQQRLFKSPNVAFALHLVETIPDFCLDFKILRAWRVMRSLVIIVQQPMESI